MLKPKKNRTAFDDVTGAGSPSPKTPPVTFPPPPSVAAVFDDDGNYHGDFSQMSHIMRLIDQYRKELSEELKKPVHYPLHWTFKMGSGNDVVWLKQNLITLIQEWSVADPHSPALPNLVTRITDGDPVTNNAITWAIERLENLSNTFDSIELEELINFFKQIAKEMENVGFFNRSKYELQLGFDAQIPLMMPDAIIETDGVKSSKIKFPTKLAPFIAFYGMRMREHAKEDGFDHTADALKGSKELRQIAMTINRGGELSPDDVKLASDLLKFYAMNVEKFYDIGIEAEEPTLDHLIIYLDISIRDVDMAAVQAWQNEHSQDGQIVRVKSRLRRNPFDEFDGGVYADDAPTFDQ